MEHHREAPAPRDEMSDAPELPEPEDLGEDTEELRRHYLPRRFWWTAREFWGPRGRRIAWLLPALRQITPHFAPEHC